MSVGSEDDCSNDGGVHALPDHRVKARDEKTITAIHDLYRYTL